MKRVSIWLLITILVIVATYFIVTRNRLVIVSTYFIVTRNRLPIISINNVKSIKVTGSPEGTKQYSIENDRKEIEDFISMYNKAKRYYHDGDTTTEIAIVFELKNGKKIAIQGNSQSYQYVYINGKHYKISGKELTSYMRTFYPRFQEK